MKISRRSRLPEAQSQASFYNAFVLLRGVEDKATYLTHLYEFYKKVSHRNNVIVNGSIEKAGGG